MSDRHVMIISGHQREGKEEGPFLIDPVTGQLIRTMRHRHKLGPVVIIQPDFSKPVDFYGPETCESLQRFVEMICDPRCRAYGFVRPKPDEDEHDED